jgi:hypothetical protein
MKEKEIDPATTSSKRLRITTHYLDKGKVFYNKCII